MKSIFNAVVLALVLIGVAGCASVKRYSIDSYQGIMPPHDQIHAYSMTID